MYNENRYYYQRNILGDITHIYSEDGLLVAKYVYDGYLEILIMINGLCFAKIDF